MGERVGAGSTGTKAALGTLIGEGSKLVKVNPKIKASRGCEGKRMQNASEEPGDRRSCSIEPLDHIRFSV